MSCAYIIANVNITDTERYDEYRRLSTEAIKQLGIEVLVRGGKTQELEGKAPGRTVIMKFPSMEAAREYYDSALYKQAREAREGAAEMTMFIIEGVTP